MSLFQIPDYSENISGRVRVLLKIIGLGRVSGTRLTLPVTWINKDRSPSMFVRLYVAAGRGIECNFESDQSRRKRISHPSRRLNCEDINFHGRADIFSSCKDSYIRWGGFPPVDVHCHNISYFWVTVLIVTNIIYFLWRLDYKLRWLHIWQKYRCQDMMNFKKLNMNESIWSKSRTASDSNNDLVLFFYDHFSGEPHLLERPFFLWLLCFRVIHKPTSSCLGIGSWEPSEMKGKVFFPLKCKKFAQCWWKRSKWK